MVQELRRKQQIKQALYSWPALVVFLIITLLLAKGAFGIMRIERQSASRVSKLEAEAEALTLRKGELEREIERLGTEEGIMEEIRDKFSATRGGEHVAIIVDERRVASSSDSWASDWYSKIADVIIFWK